MSVAVVDAARSISLSLFLCREALSPLETCFFLLARTEHIGISIELSAETRTRTRKGLGNERGRESKESIKWLPRRKKNALFVRLLNRRTLPQPLQLRGRASCDGHEGELEEAPRGPGGERDWRNNDGGS